MYLLQDSNLFKKGLKDLQKQGNKRGIEECKKVITKLQNNIPLEPSYKDHKLNINKFIVKDSRVCHLKFDLLLVYRKLGNILYLDQIGNHHTLKGFVESKEI